MNHNLLTEGDNHRAVSAPLLSAARVEASLSVPGRRASLVTFFRQAAFSAEAQKDPSADVTGLVLSKCFVKGKKSQE